MKLTEAHADFLENIQQNNNTKCKDIYHGKQIIKINVKPVQLKKINNFTIIYY